MQNRLDKKGDRIAYKLDNAKGDEINAHLDAKGERINNRIDKKGDRIKARMDPKGLRKHNRATRRANRRN